MNEKHLDRLLVKYDLGHALDTLSGMKRHEIITLLMALVEKRAQSVTPPDVLRQYDDDRFIGPSTVSQRDFHQVDAVAFRLAEAYEAVELSPLAPQGICSAVAPVDPAWIVHSTRMQELISDCMNVLAAIAAMRRRHDLRNAVDTLIQLCSSHRHTRAQAFDHPLFSAHFRVFAMIDAGRDSGSLTFEKAALIRHVDFYTRFFRAFSETAKLPLHLTVFVLQEDASAWDEHVARYISGIERMTLAVVPGTLTQGGYYWPLRFQMRVVEPEPMDIVDGGLVDWTQHFLSDRKERLLISGIGTEIFIKKYLKGAQ